MKELAIKYLRKRLIFSSLISFSGFAAASYFYFGLSHMSIYLFFLIIASQGLYLTAFFSWKMLIVSRGELLELRSTEHLTRGSNMGRLKHFIPVVINPKTGTRLSISELQQDHSEFFSDPIILFIHKNSYFLIPDVLKIRAT